MGGPFRRATGTYPIRPTHVEISSVFACQARREAAAGEGRFISRSPQGAHGRHPLRQSQACAGMANTILTLAFHQQFCPLSSRFYLLGIHTGPLLITFHEFTSTSGGNKPSVEQSSSILGFNRSRGIGRRLLTFVTIQLNLGLSRIKVVRTVCLDLERPVVR